MATKKRRLPLRSSARRLVRDLLRDLRCYKSDWRFIDGGIWARSSPGNHGIGIFADGRLCCIHYVPGTDDFTINNIWVPLFQRWRLRREVRRLNIEHAQQVFDGQSD